MKKPEFNFIELRAQMVDEQLRERDITDEAVLQAFLRVPREDFVEPVDWDEAYEDHPLGIECGQTISQPYMVALMTQLLELRPDLRVLEIGTGSGYQAAILAELGAKVFSVERFSLLSQQAARALEKNNYLRRVTLRVGDGSVGWPEEGPFDRIILTCCAPNPPLWLRDQLAAGGRIIAPVQHGAGQMLQILEHDGQGGLCVRDVLPVIFVNLIGRQGYPERG